MFYIGVLFLGYLLVLSRASLGHCIIYESDIYYDKIS